MNGFYKPIELFRKKKSNKDILIIFDWKQST